MRIRILSISEDQTEPEWGTFPLKGHRVNLLGVVNHVWSLSLLHLPVSLLPLFSLLLLLLHPHFKVYTVRVYSSTIKPILSSLVIQKQALSQTWASGHILLTLQFERIIKGHKGWDGGVVEIR